MKKLLYVLTIFILLGILVSCNNSKNYVNEVEKILISNDFIKKTDSNDDKDLLVNVNKSWNDKTDSPHKITYDIPIELERITNYVKVIFVDDNHQNDLYLSCGITVIKNAEQAKHAYEKQVEYYKNNNSLANSTINEMKLVDNVIYNFSAPSREKVEEITNLFNSIDGWKQN